MLRYSLICDCDLAFYCNDLLSCQKLVQTDNFHLVPYIYNRIAFAGILKMSIRSFRVHPCAVPIIPSQNNSSQQKHLIIGLITGKDSDQNIIGDVTPEGYTFHHAARTHRKSGGVGVLLCDSLTYKQHRCSQSSSFEI